MQPTGPQIERLHQDLLSAYPRLEHVRAMVRIHLDVDLDAIVPLYGQNQADILFALIEHYASQPGGMHRLIRAARVGCVLSTTSSSVLPPCTVVQTGPCTLMISTFCRRGHQWIPIP